MRLRTLTFAFIGLFMFSTALLAQGSLDCLTVQGSMELTIGDTNIDGTVTADLEGTVAGEIIETNDLGFGSLVTFDGTISDTAGNLSTSGILLKIDFDPMGMMSLVLARFGVTGGDGDYEEAVGVIYAFGIVSPMTSGLSYFGVICTPKEEPPGKP